MLAAVSPGSPSNEQHVNDELFFKTEVGISPKVLTFAAEFSTYTTEKEMDTSFLQQLGLQADNAGTFTGLESSDSGNYIESYSPVDGALIGRVSVTTNEEYEAVVNKAAAAFDELTRSGKDDELVRQIRNAWPNVFRAARFVPAVEYIQANRIRTQLITEMAAVFEQVDFQR